MQQKFMPTLDFLFFNRNPMFWTKEHDVLFCREILVSKLFETRKSSIERGKVWDTIAANLNSITKPTFDVDKRSVRDHLNSLISKYKRKNRREENASGNVGFLLKGANSTFHLKRYAN